MKLRPLYTEYRRIVTNGRFRALRERGGHRAYASCWRIANELRAECLARREPGEKAPSAAMWQRILELPVTGKVLEPREGYDRIHTLEQSIRDWAELAGLSVAWLKVGLRWLRRLGLLETAHRFGLAEVLDEEVPPRRRLSMERLRAEFPGKKRKELRELQSRVMVVCRTARRWLSDSALARWGLTPSAAEEFARRKVEWVKAHYDEYTQGEREKERVRRRRGFAVPALVDDVDDQEVLDRLLERDQEARSAAEARLRPEFVVSAEDAGDIDRVRARVRQALGIL